MSYSKLLKEIMYDEDNISYTEKGIKPLFSAPETAQIIIIAQAPGIRAQELGIFFNDLSGDKLREWLGIDRECFYDSGYFAVVPMDYYFPGKGKTGDLPPRKGFAEKYKVIGNWSYTIKVDTRMKGLLCQDLNVLLKKLVHKR